VREWPEQHARHHLIAVEAASETGAVVGDVRALGVDLSATLLVAGRFNRAGLDDGGAEVHAPAVGEDATTAFGGRVVADGGEGDVRRPVLVRDAAAAA